MNRATKQEKRVARDIGGKRQAASGSRWHSKGDAKGARFLVDAKYTDAKQYVLKVKDIEKLRREALYERRRDWCIQVDFPGGLQVAVMPYNVLLELEERASG